MAGGGKLLKQAQKMQKQVEAMQAGLAETMLDVSYGGGAVAIRVSGSGEFHEVTLSEDLIKEDKALIEETLLGAIREASQKAREYGESEMEKATGGFNLPGMPGL